MRALLWFYIFSLGPPAWSLPRVPLVLFVGEQRVLNVPGLERYSIGAPHALTVYRLGRERLLLRAAAPLRTTLTIESRSEAKSALTTQDVAIWIDPTPAGAAPPGLRSALGFIAKIPEIQAIATDQGFILRGELTTREQAALLQDALALVPPPTLKSEISLSTELLQVGQAALTRAIGELPSPHPALECLVLDSQLWVRGSHTTLQERDTVARKLRAAFPLWEDQTQILREAARTAYFKVYLLEIERTRGMELGVRWPSSTGTITVTPQSGVQLTPWEMHLEHLEKAGDLQILSAPEISVITPGEGEFFSGGEIPIRVHNRFVSQTQWKPYGLSLKIKTIAAFPGQIRFEIQTEASHLDPATGSEGVPGMRINRLRTEIQATFGEPLMLTGLVQSQTSEAREGLPFFSRIPLLGRLFSTEHEQDERRELVVSVLAHAAPPPPPTARIGRALPRGHLPLRWLAPPERDTEIPEALLPEVLP